MIEPTCLTYFPSFSVYSEILGSKREPTIICNGCMNMIGAQYAARFGLPSNIVFTRGKPNAKVLWDEQNIDATISL